MKKLVNQSKRLGVIALMSMSLVAFSACGGGDEAEALIKKEYPNAKVLSFDEAKKEVGLTDKECLKIKISGGGYSYYHFVKINDEIKFVDVYYSGETNKPNMVGKIYELDLLKTQNDRFRDPKPECFN